MSDLKFDQSRVDVVDFLEALDCENITEATEEEVRFSCPFPGHPHGDQNPSAYMNRETTAWYCHGCKRHGNSTSFLALVGQITYMEATKFLIDRYGGMQPDPDSYSIKAELERFYKNLDRGSKPVFDVELDEDLRERFRVNWEEIGAMDGVPPWAQYIGLRGFTVESLLIWNIGYDPISRRLTIPTFNVNGTLAGFKGRAWDGRKPKYLILGGDKYGWPRYHKSRVLFGLREALGGHESIPELILVEGELNVIALDAMGFPNAASVAGSDFSSAQIRLVKRHAESVVVLFDSDQSGFSGTRSVVDSLSADMLVKVAPDHEGDPADWLKRGTPAVPKTLIAEAESVLRAELASRLSA